MDEVLVERVLRAVEQVPRGRVVSYGDVAAAWRRLVRAASGVQIQRTKL